jgi:tetratricopeptide (TPR) repeat protein
MRTPTRLRRSLFLLPLLMGAAAAQAAISSPYCGVGERLVRAGSFTDGATLLSTCLATPELAAPDRRYVLLLRASAYFNLHENALALLDQEAAFAIAAPSTVAEYINYGSYLRRVARFEDSLQALRGAEALAKQKQQVGMMVLFNLGWTLLELKRYDEAIDAFTQGIAHQPDFPFSYWRRALAYEALGREGEARADIAAAARFLLTGSTKFPEDASVAALRVKVRQYGLDQQYVF